MVKGTNTSWTAQKNSNFSPQLTAQTAIYSKELDVLPDDNLFKISLYDNKIPSNVNPDNSELIEGLTSEFSFSLLPAVESQTSGRQVPDVKPGILYKYSTNIKPYPIPGRAATHQVIGFDSTILQVVGLLTGFNDIISNSAGDQSILAVKQGKGNAVQAAQAFFNYVYRYGVPIRIRIRANQSANNMTMGYSDVLYNNRQPNSFVSLYHICIIQSIRYFVARHDRVYYALDLIILEEDDLWNNTSEEVFNNPTTTIPASFGGNSLAEEIASQLGEKDKITQSEKDGVTTTEIILEDGSKIVITQNSDGSRKVEYFKKATDTKPSSVSITTPTGETSTTGKPPDENTPADKIIKAILKKPPNTPVVEKKEEEDPVVGNGKKPAPEPNNWFINLLKKGPTPGFGRVDIGAYSVVGVGLGGYGLRQYMKNRGSTNDILDNITNKIPANSTNRGAIASVNQIGTRTGTTNAIDQYLGLSNNKAYNTISYTKANGDIVEIVYDPDGKALGGTVKDPNGRLLYNVDSDGQNIILNTTTGKVQLELDENNRPIVSVEELNSSTSNTIKQTPVDFANTATTSDDMSGLIFESGTGTNNAPTGNTINKITPDPNNSKAITSVVQAGTSTHTKAVDFGSYIGLKQNEIYEAVFYKRADGNRVFVYYDDQKNALGGYIMNENGTILERFDNTGQRLIKDANDVVKVDVDSNGKPIISVEELNSSNSNGIKSLPAGVDLDAGKLNNEIFNSPESTDNTKIPLGTDGVNGILERTPDGKIYITNSAGESSQLVVTSVNGKPAAITLNGESLFIDPVTGNIFDSDNKPVPFTIEDIQKLSNTGTGTGTNLNTGTDTNTGTVISGDGSNVASTAPSNKFSSAQQQTIDRLIGDDDWVAETLGTDGRVSIRNEAGEVIFNITEDGYVLRGSSNKFEGDIKTEYISNNTIRSDRTGRPVVETPNPTGSKLDAQNFTETFNIPNNSATYVQVELPNGKKISLDKNTGKITDLDTGRDVEMYVTPTGEIQVKSSGGGNGPDDPFNGPSGGVGNDLSESSTNQTPQEITGSGSNDLNVFGEGLGNNNNDFNIATGDVLITGDTPRAISNLSNEYNNPYPAGVNTDTNINPNIPTLSVSFNQMTEALTNINISNKQILDDGNITINLGATEKTIGTPLVINPNGYQPVAQIKNTSVGDVNIITHGGTFQIHTPSGVIAVGASVNELSNALTGKLGLPSNKVNQILNGLGYLFHAF